MTSSNLVLFDSNILIWAHDTESPHHRKAKELVEAALTKKINACLAHQNLLEFLSIVTNPKRLSQTLSLTKTLKIVGNYLRYFNIISPQEATLNLVLMSIRDFKMRKAKVFDAYLVATMLTNNIATIYTANDKDFKKFADKIKIVNPFRSTRK